MTDSPFRILVICTGNICRSPAAELLLADRLGPAAQVSSAGVHGLTGHGIHPQMARLLPVDSHGFRARQLSEEMLKDSDLVLAMTRDHRSAAVELYPACVRRAFTFLEFARIIAIPDAFPVATNRVDYVAGAVPFAGTMRQRVRAQQPSDDDVFDPYGFDDTVFAESYAVIERGVAAIGGPA